MKIIFSIALILLSKLYSEAQTNVSFDQLSFIEPANWTLADNGSYRTYSIANNSTNIYCLIAMYNSNVSSGNPEQDFLSEWKRNVAKNFTVLKKPVPEKNTSPGGINYLQDEADVANSKGHFFARLLVFELSGKMQSILFLSGDLNSITQYQSDLDKFVASLQPTSVANNNDISTPQNTDLKDESAPELVHFKHFLFAVPDGWKAGQTGNFYSITPDNLSGDEQLIFLLFPPVTGNSFKDAGNAAINQLAASIGGQAKGFGSADGSVYEFSNEGLCKKGWEYSMGSGRIQVNNMADFSKSMTFGVGVFLAKINGRIERVLYLSKNFKCDGVSTTSSYNAAYEPVITNFFFDLRFDDWKDEKVSQGRVSHSGISHVWSGVSYMNKGLNTMGTYDASFFIFFNNGQVYYNTTFPLHGLLNLNTIAAAANDPHYWGTYTYQNGSGEINISYRKIPFKFKGGELVAEMNSTTRSFEKLPVIDDARLEGTWCSTSLNGCVSFTKDGKFNDNGVMRSLDHLPTSCNAAAPASGEGIYEIKSNSLLLHYTNGIIIQTALSGLNLQKTNVSPDKLFLGPHNDVLQKK